MRHEAEQEAERVGAKVAATFLGATPKRPRQKPHRCIDCGKVTRHVRCHECGGVTACHVCNWSRS